MKATTPFDAVLAGAIARGLLPADAALPAAAAGRPWPLQLLTALGAWLVMIPLLLAFGMLFGEWLTRSAAGIPFGLLLMLGAVVVLRSARLGAFVEQLAFPALLTGGGIVGINLFERLPQAPAEILMLLLTLAAAVAVPQTWLRGCLGGAAALWLALACGGRGDHGLLFLGWGAGAGWFAVLAAWVVVQPLLGTAGVGRARWLAALEAIAGGWAMTLLGGLAWWSGSSLLVGAGNADLLGFVEFFSRTAMPPPVLSLLAVAAGLLGAANILRCWPDFRAGWFVGIALILAALACVLPALGGTALVLAVAATRRRAAVAVAASVAALWIIGAFYYRLHLPLDLKALLLVASGLLVGVLCRLGSSRPRAESKLSESLTTPSPPLWGGRQAGDAPKRVQKGEQGGFPGALTADRDALSTTGSKPAAALIALSLLLVLTFANLGIRQKETLITEGRPIYLEIIPVDPRSLMQGDYIRLAFRMPVSVDRGVAEIVGATRPRVIARVDRRGVAEIRRHDDGQPLAADEFRIELTPKGGRWIVVSDAWFFREGDGARWQAARYAEFRVDAEGKALLVGMADKDLKAIR